MRSPAHARTAVVLLLSAVAGASVADSARADAYRDDIGLTALAEKLDGTLPDAAGLRVLHVEAPVSVEGGSTWMPDRSNPAFAGKSLLNRSLAPPGLHSGHAQSTARLFYGSPGSIAPGIAVIDVYSSQGFLAAVLRTTPEGPGPQPRALSARIGSHSWVAEAPPLDSQILRRNDWLIDRDELVQVVGLTNGGRNRQLLANGWNVIAVGRSDGQHGVGTVALDDTYTAGRVRPQIVVPARTTSEATPKVAALLALLLGEALARPELSTDPVAPWTETRLGQRLPNGARSEVLRAVLMAGAMKETTNASAPDLDGWRARETDRAPNGMDRRYGAGQANVFRSHAILTAGEQNSREDEPERRAAGPAGFDYDPSFGGAGNSNARATYVLPEPGGPARLHVSLTWNLAIDGGTPSRFDGSATLHELDLALLELRPGRTDRVLARSAGRGDNSQHLYERLEPGRRYAIRVGRADGAPAFDWDYAVAWYLDTAL